MKLRDRVYDLVLALILWTVAAVNLYSVVGWAGVRSTLLVFAATVFTISSHGAVRKGK